jgi:hypothetical protein
MRTGVLGLLLLAASGAAARAQDGVGFYDASGTNPDGSAYSGAVVIEATSSDTCAISWQIAGRDDEINGFCMRRGNVLSAYFEMGNVVGLVIYDIERDGSLQGSWTIADQPGVGTEMLTPLLQ